ncbi:MAG: type II toxin-antitoxin system RelE/ParE family toxin [Mycobacteriales bacterium]
MTYRITLAPSAARQGREFDPQVRRRLQAALELLADEPRPPSAIQLVGAAGEWRVRTGDYRIVYEISDEASVVLVLRLGHRRDLYRVR